MSEIKKLFTTCIFVLAFASPYSAREHNGFKHKPYNKRHLLTCLEGNSEYCFLRFLNFQLSFFQGLYDIHIKLQGVPLLGWDAPVLAVGMNVR